MFERAAFMGVAKVSSAYIHVNITKVLLMLLMRCLLVLVLIGGTTFNRITQQILRLATTI